MAEETKQEVEQVEAEPQGEAKPETDWKAEARKWEQRAKKSQAAELELEALKQAQMTEQEKANARAEKAESELAALKAENQRLADAKDIAAASGVPVRLLEYCADREAMEAFAKEYIAERPATHSAASASGSRIVRNQDVNPPSKGDVFANAVAGLL